MGDTTSSKRDQPDPNFESFRRALREHRKEAGLTQGQLATKINYSLSTVSEAERGTRRRMPHQRFIVVADEALRAEGALMKAAGLDPSTVYTDRPADDSPLKQDMYDELQRMWRRMELIIDEHEGHYDPRSDSE